MQVDQIWAGLGFVLQWAKYRLTFTTNNQFIHYSRARYRTLSMKQKIYIQKNRWALGRARI